MFLEIVPPITIIKDAAIDLLKDVGKWILKHLIGAMCADFYMSESEVVDLCSRMRKIGPTEWVDYRKSSVFNGLFWISGIGFAFVKKETSEDLIGIHEQVGHGILCKGKTKLSTLRWNQEVVRELLKKHNMKRLGARNIVDIESMCLNVNAERVLRDVMAWSLDEKWYKAREITYTFGVLAYGPPGSGKSTFASKLAEVTKRSIKKIDIVKRTSFMEDVKTYCSIWLIEDIDTVFDGRTNISGSCDPLDFGDLLNALSGVNTTSGRIVIITTNAPERLDPALAHVPTNGDPPVPRPGRIDRILYIGAMEAQAREKMVRKILPDRSDLWHDLVLAGEGETIALFQARCVQIALSNRRSNDRP